MTTDFMTRLRRIRYSLVGRKKLLIVVRDISSLHSETAFSEPADSEIQYSLITNLDEMKALRDEFLGFSRDSIADVEQRVEQGCILFVFRTFDPEARKWRLIAYCIAQRGVFSVFGTLREISDDILFGHYIEVLADYRGRGLKERLDIKREQYCARQGLKKMCGVISPGNITSLKANAKSGFRVVGSITRIIILKRFVIWQTRWKTIENAVYGIS